MWEGVSLLVVSRSNYQTIPAEQASAYQADDHQDKVKEPAYAVYPRELPPQIRAMPLPLSGRDDLSLIAYFWEGIYEQPV